MIQNLWVIECDDGKASSKREDGSHSFVMKEHFSSYHYVLGDFCVCTLNVEKTDFQEWMHLPAEKDIISKWDRRKMHSVNLFIIFDY